MRKCGILSLGSPREKVDDAKQHVNNSSHKHDPLVTAGSEILYERTANIGIMLLADPYKTIDFIGKTCWIRVQNKQKT